MHRQQSRVAAKLDDEIAITYRVHRVLAQLWPAVLVHKTHRPRYELPVQGQRRTSQSAAAKRANVGPLPALRQPLAIPFEHFDICQEMMRQVNGLRSLQMSITGKYHFLFPLRELDEGLLEQPNFRQEFPQFIQ